MPSASMSMTPGGEDYSTLPVLEAGARELLGLQLSSTQLAQFEVYQRELLAWNERLNLTSITDSVQVQVKHFLDSLSCLLGFPEGSCPQPPSGAQPHRSCRLIDVGSGAGFPGLPLKIACPELRLTCLESVGKKTNFLRHLVQALDLAGVEIVTARAEELARSPDHREGYDLVVSRAVAEMRVLAEYCLPFAAIGGHFIAQKDADIEAELGAARRAIGLLGGRLLKTVPVELPGLAGQRQLVVVEKARPTPSPYPRRTGTPRRSPL